MEQWQRQCDECAQVKPGPRHRANMTSMTVGSPMDRVAMDILGELPETPRGNKYILVLSDYFTKWCEAFPLPDQTAYTVADVVVQQFITRFGTPRVIHTDQGKNFESELFKNMRHLLGIKKSRTTTYHAQSDGLVERLNRTLLQILRVMTGERQDDWDEALPYAISAYRHSRRESTGFSPFQLMFGREVTLPIDIMYGSPPHCPPSCTTEYSVWLKESMQNAHQQARRHLKRAAERQKNYYDSKYHPYPFKEGQFVWRYVPKLSKDWVGPFKISSIPNSHHCLLQKQPGQEPIRVHCDQLKPYMGRSPRGWGTPSSELLDEEAEEITLPTVEEASEEGEELSDQPEEPPRSPVENYSMTKDSSSQNTCKQRCTDHDAESQPAEKPLEAMGELGR